MEVFSVRAIEDASVLAWSGWTIDSIHRLLDLETRSQMPACADVRSRHQSTRLTARGRADDH
jgi:hypothetical protein